MCAAERGEVRNTSAAPGQRKHLQNISGKQPAFMPGHNEQHLMERAQQQSAKKLRQDAQQWWHTLLIVLSVHKGVSGEGRAISYASKVCS